MSKRGSFEWARSVVIESAEARAEEWDARARGKIEMDNIEAVLAVYEADRHEAADIHALLMHAIQTLRSYRPRPRFQVRGAYLREHRDAYGKLTEEWWESYPVAAMNRVGFELGAPDKWAIYRWQDPGPNEIAVQDYVEEFDELVDAVERLEELNAPWRAA